ncbi:Hypothetical predicted protein [Olea europaea subsp. europaea]|uniref:Uncharacterized protein n=1 Tax=Olea europaea subsp. europaea TaxID=158383 RepID=A0A8S0PI74_OLEEU|nr:Hypothetical predicted protein [Olea europaea subsp. europaea]
MEVHYTLNPTDDELLEPFWKESRPFDDKVDPKLDNVASKDEGKKESQSDDAQSSFAHPQCPKTFDRPSMSSHLHSSKTARRPSPSYDYITHIIKQEIRCVEERLQGKMSERFNQVEMKIDLFLQLAGRGRVQSERSEFDDRAFSTGNQQNKEAREQYDVIIEDALMKKSRRISNSRLFLHMMMGHRVKRRATVLLSPYTNPLKRRKLLNIQAYDPLREVDPVKVEDLYKWLANASTR